MAFIAVMFALPIFLGGNSHAETFKTNVDIAPKLMVTLPSSATQVNVDPSYSQFDYNTLQIQVSTNNPTGYYTTVSSETTNLIKKEDSSKFIPTIEEAGYYYSSSFPVNHWGYSTDNGNTYQPFVSGARIAGKDTAANGDYVNMYIATKVDYLQSPGTYEIELTFVTVVNYLPPSYIQDVDPMTCMEEPRTVVDMRDGEEYTIQKLNDGRCWMLDNLRLDPTEVSLNDLKGKTNASDESLTYLKNGGGENQYAAEPVSSEWVDSFYNSYYTPKISNTYKDTEITPIYDGPGFVTGRAGVYYNYCAASAGSYCWPAYSSESFTSTEDICPAGWRLPTVTDSDALNEAYDVAPSWSYNNVAEALRVPLSGGLLYSDAELYKSGEQGRYWTSSNYGGQRFWRYFEFDISTSGDSHKTYLTTGNEPRTWGHSIRCILDEPDISQATYLQDVKRAMVYNMNVGDTATLKDKRDNEEYLVAKLADGRLWLLDNLRLDPTTTPLSNLQGNTNAPDVALGYLKNGGGEGKYPADAVQTTSNYSVSYDEPFVVVDYKDDVLAGTPGLGSGKRGVYYNWCTATAGTDCYMYSWSEPIGETDTRYDICPKGWQLPRGSYNGDFHTLYNTVSSWKDRAMITALSIPMKNLMYDNTGWLWTSRYSGANEVYIVMVQQPGEGESDYERTIWNEDKDFDSSQNIRCILK